MSKSRPRQWRVPPDISDWLDAQPAGFSGTLERLCRVAMGVEKDPATVELEGRIDELRRLVERHTSTPLAETTEPAPTEAPASVNILW